MFLPPMRMRAQCNFSIGMKFQGIFLTEDDSFANFSRKIDLLYWNNELPRIYQKKVLIQNDPEDHVFVYIFTFYC